MDGIAAVEAAQLTGWPHTDAHGPDAVRWRATCDDDAFAAGRLACELLKRRELRIGETQLSRKLGHDVRAELQRRNILFAGERGYSHARELHGMLVVAKGVDGNEYVLAALSGGEASNDHYPQYHAIFRVDGDALRLVSSDRYFIDVAGIEGATWWVMAIFLAIMLVPAALLVVVLRRRLSGGTPSALLSQSMNSHS